MRVPGLTVDDVAGELGLSSTTVRGFIHIGALRASRFGMFWSVARADLDRFIEACRIQPGELDAP